MSTRSIPTTATPTKNKNKSQGINIITSKTEGNSPERSTQKMTAVDNVQLGMIKEDSQGAKPDKSPIKTTSKQRHGMMKRLSTDEWNEASDKV